MSEFGSELKRFDLLDEQEKETAFEAWRSALREARKTPTGFLDKPARQGRLDKVLAECDLQDNDERLLREFSSSRVGNHCLRMLKRERTDVEHDFGRKLLHEIAQSSDSEEEGLSHDIEWLIGGEGDNTTLFYTVGPYLYRELQMQGLDPERAFEQIFRWAEQATKQKKEAFEKAKKDFGYTGSEANVISLQGLEFLSAFGMQHGTFILSQEHGHASHRLAEHLASTVARELKPEAKPRILSAAAIRDADDYRVWQALLDRRFAELRIPEGEREKISQEMLIAKERKAYEDLQVFFKRIEKEQGSVAHYDGLQEEVGKTQQKIEQTRERVEDIRNRIAAFQNLQKEHDRLEAQAVDTGEAKRLQKQVWDLKEEETLLRASLGGIGGTFRGLFKPKMQQEMQSKLEEVVEEITKLEKEEKKILDAAYKVDKNLKKIRKDLEKASSALGINGVSSARADIVGLGLLEEELQASIDKLSRKRGDAEFAKLVPHAKFFASLHQGGAEVDLSKRSEVISVINNQLDIARAEGHLEEKGR